jgi:hypothetical protein
MRECVLVLLKESESYRKLLESIYIHSFKYLCSGGNGVDDCWGITRKIRIITQTQEEFSTRSSTQLGRREFEMLSANGTSPKKV